METKEYIHQLSIDCVFFGYNQTGLKVLIPKLDLAEDFWALPSGFIRQDEDINDAAQRIIKSRVGDSTFYFEQFRIFGEADRNNKHVISKVVESNTGLQNIEPIDYEWITRRFVSIGYFALLDISSVSLTLGHLDKQLDWYDYDCVPKLIIDHNYMVEMARKAIRLSFDENLLALYLMPKEFTMKELQNLYEVVFNRSFARNNFQKKMLDMNVLERLEKKFTGAQNKAPYLYRFNHLPPETPSV